ncbi:MAG: metallophosphoesterase [Holophagaceae bacterium]|nr:metallophosphoesterase [Holophagaceae bacterium]
MLRATLALLLPLLLAAAPAGPQRAAAPARPQTPAALLADGPHVLWEGNTARIFEVRDGDQLGERRAKAPLVLALPGLAAGGLRLDGKAYPTAPEALPDPGRILAVSDLHGSFDAFLALLQAQRVVDAQRRWTFGKGHLVVVGDVFDRGSQVTECLWFLRALEVAARKAGGAVHFILGNHEAMVMAGDLRYLHPKYTRAPQGLPAYPELFGPASELGRWLRSRPSMLKLGSFLFVHGGPSPALLDQGLDLKATNQAVRQALGRPGRTLDGLAAFLLGEAGPHWYRGLVPGATGQDAGGPDLDRMLATYGVKAIVIGHTTLDRLTPLHGGRVFAIDAGLKDGRPGEAWLWEKGRVWRGTLDGRREALAP